MLCFSLYPCCWRSVRCGIDIWSALFLLLVSSECFPFFCAFAYATLVLLFAFFCCRCSFVSRVWWCWLCLLKFSSCCNLSFGAIILLRIFAIVFLYLRVGTVSGYYFEYSWLGRTMAVGGILLVVGIYGLGLGVVDRYKMGRPLRWVAGRR